MKDYIKVSFDTRRKFLSFLAMSVNARLNLDLDLQRVLCIRYETYFQLLLAVETSLWLSLLWLFPEKE